VAAVLILVPILPLISLLASLMPLISHREGWIDYVLLEDKRLHDYDVLLKFNNISTSHSIIQYSIA
jgi:hypothetical protein